MWTLKICDVQINTHKEYVTAFMFYVRILKLIDGEILILNFVEKNAYRTKFFVSSRKGQVKSRMSREFYVLMEGF